MTNNDGITQPRSADSLTHSARPVTDHLVEVVGEDEYGRPFTAVCYAESETHKALLQPRRAGALAATIAGGVVAFLFGYALVSHLVVGTMSTVAAIVGATFLSFFGALGVVPSSSWGLHPPSGQRSFEPSSTRETSFRRSDHLWRCGR